MTRRRLAVLLLTGGAALALGVAAWPFLYARLVAPLALLSWLLLRLFVLSLDERLVWLILTGAVPVALLLALRERIAASPTTAVRNPVVRGHPVDVWRALVEESALGGRRRRAFGWDGLVQLAVSQQALYLRVPADYRLHHRLRTGEVPLPPHLHAFLFPPAPATEPGLRSRIRRILQAPARTLDHLSGRERAAFLWNADEFLTFLEGSLEMPRHDDSRP